MSEKHEALPHLVLTLGVSSITAMASILGRAGCVLKGAAGMLRDYIWLVFIIYLFVCLFIYLFLSLLSSLLLGQIEAALSRIPATGGRVTLQAKLDEVHTPPLDELRIRN